MKKTLVGFFAVVAALLLNAETEKVGGFTWTYESCAEGEVEIWGVTPDPSGVLEIPSKLGGCEVVAIGCYFLNDEDSRITGVKIPSSVRYIGTRAFNECPYLKSVEFNEGLLSIGSAAFAKCPLESLVIPSTVTEIGECAFTCSNYGGLAPELKKAGSAAKMRTAKGLKSIKINGGDNYRFSTADNILYDKVNRRLITVSPYCAQVSVPEGCEHIGKEALLNCYDLTSISFPSTLKTIGVEAFAACVKIGNLNFSETNLECVGVEAFCGCLALKSTSFPVSLRFLGAGAFGGDNNLTSVTYAGDAPDIEMRKIQEDGGLDEHFKRDIEASEYRNDGCVYAYGVYGNEWTYKGHIKGVVSHVMPGSTGWGGSVWQRCKVVYDADKGGNDVPGGEEAVVFSCPGLTNDVFTVGVIGSSDPIVVNVESLSSVKSIKASKLPSGMKLAKDKKSGLWTITGAPKKAGEYDVVLTLTTTDGSKQTLTYHVSVAALPQWATGTFGGMIGRFTTVGEDDDFRPYGLVDMKITAAGKITAKIAAGGKTYSFSANGFDSVEERDGYKFYHFSIMTKKGDVYEGEIAQTYHDVETMLDCGGYGDPEGSFTPAGIDPYYAIVWRNEHGKDGRLSTDPSGKAKNTMDAIKAMKALMLADYYGNPAYGSLQLTIGKDGSTKLSGKTADGVKPSFKNFLKLDDDSYHIISDLVYYDKKSGLVYSSSICWCPIFDTSGNVTGFGEECCDHQLEIYPFE